MKIFESIKESRKETEKHIRALEEEGQAGERYTLGLPDQPMIIFGLIGDLGVLIMLIDGIIHLFHASVLLKSDLLFLLIGMLYLVYLNVIHEKEICTKAQRDGGFGLILLAGIIGIICGLQMNAKLYIAGSVMTIIGCLPIYVSFKKGIRYEVE